MQDVFVCPAGDMLENWEKAFPKALVSADVSTLSSDKEVLLWVQVNANDQAWLDQTLSAIADKFPTAKRVMLANTPNQQEALDLMAKGAVGYCHAYSAPRMLKELKTVVLNGGLWLGSDLLQALINATKQVAHNSSAGVVQALNQLTTREKEVALEAAEGLTNKEIARVLDITERTVKAHMSSVFDKLGVRDRLQLAIVLNDKPSDASQNTLH